MFDSLELILLTIDEAVRAVHYTDVTNCEWRTINDIFYK